jgi:hypothetical protein
MRKISVFIIAMLMTGCGAVGAYRGMVAETGADAADQALESAEWAMCNGVPVGAVKRRYNTEEKRNAYNQICTDAALP